MNLQSAIEELITCWKAGELDEIKITRFALLFHQLGVEYAKPEINVASKFYLGLKYNAPLASE
jgi:hypothetical protein